MTLNTFVRLGLVGMLAWGAADTTHAAQGRQLCRFPDGERRVVHQELGAMYGLSVSDCQPLVLMIVTTPDPETSAAGDASVDPPTTDEGAAPVAIASIASSTTITTITAPTWRSVSAAAWLPSARRADVEVPVAYQLLIARSARSHGVDPQIVEAVMYVESRFEPNARSNKGALGLMQLMPQTAQQYGVRTRAGLFDPATNIECGTRYLGELTAYFAGRIDLALAAYNAGPGAVIRHGWRVPPFAETQAYVDRVLQRMNSR